MQLSICDRCREQGTLKKVKIGEKEVELCISCSQHIIDWIQAGVKPKGLLGKMGSMIGG